MPLKLKGPVSCAALLLAGIVAAPALADVKAGVDAWSRGDYAAAVKEWQAPADAGDPDAMFNLAQAYRLGRGVSADPRKAEDLYARAAQRGHLQAADTYGLMLFQDGRRAQAVPYLQDAVRRGDPRSQYLLGVAHFNGDVVAKDWVRAYALVTLANAAGLPQAAQALAQMDASIPLTQRQQAQALAQQLRAEADANRSAQVAAADLSRQDTGRPAASMPAAAGAPLAAATPRVPRPIPTIAVPPSVAIARAAVDEAGRVTGTESPAEAGASFARAPAPARPALARAPIPAPTPTPSPAPVVVARLEPPATRPAAPRVTLPAQRPPASAAPAQVASTPPRPAAAAATGPWRVQLGAFSVAGNAQRLWAELSARPELAGKQRLLVPAGAATKLQAGGFATRDAAESACRTLHGAGHDCLVTDR